MASGAPVRRGTERGRGAPPPPERSYAVHSEGTWVFFSGEPVWRSAEVTSAFPLEITAVDAHHNIRVIGLRTTLRGDGKGQGGEGAHSQQVAAFSNNVSQRGRGGGGG